MSICAGLTLFASVEIAIWVDCRRLWYFTMGFVLSEAEPSCLYAQVSEAGGCRDDLSHGGHYGRSREWNKWCIAGAMCSCDSWVPKVVCETCTSGWWWGYNDQEVGMLLMMYRLWQCMALHMTMHANERAGEASHKKYFMFFNEMWQIKSFFHCNIWVRHLHWQGCCQYYTYQLGGCLIP